MLDEQLDFSGAEPIAAVALFAVARLDWQRLPMVHISFSLLLSRASCPHLGKLGSRSTYTPSAVADTFAAVVAG